MTLVMTMKIQGQYYGGILACYVRLDHGYTIVTFLHTVP